MPPHPSSPHRRDNMITAAHQPVYLPGIIFFNKLALCDAFIFLSDVQLSRGRSWQTRNRIRQGSEAGFLSVPVKRKGRSDQRIYNTIILSDNDWQRRHVASIQHAYGKRPYFSQYFPSLAAIIEQPWSTLADLNIALIRHLAIHFGLSPKWYDSREFELPDGKNERLVALARALGSDTYISNPGSTMYVNESTFAAGGVRHLWQHFEHPVYEQGAPFLTNLSVIDLLFNLGPNAASVIRASGSAKIEKPTSSGNEGCQ